MTAGQVILVFSSVALAAVAYLFGPLHSPQKGSPEHSVEVTEQSDFDFAAYKAEELKKLPAAEFEKYVQLQKEIESGFDKRTKLVEAEALLFNNGLSLLALFTRRDIAAIENTDTSWSNIGLQLFSAYAPDNQPFSKYVLSQAIACFEKALELNPENTDVKIQLAVAHLDGQIEPMKGVMLLREITDKDPGNITANLILGKYGIVSGQFDKAVQRLEKVLSVDSLNVDAYLYLAEAYEGMGNKEKAIEALEKCKTLVQDARFSNEISSYIEKLKNS